MLGEESEATTYRADECKCGGVREMVGLARGCRVDDMFRRILRDSSALRRSSGCLTGCEQECVDAPTPFFVRMIEVPTGVCGSWD